MSDEEREPQFVSSAIFQAMLPDLLLNEDPFEVLLSCIEGARLRVDKGRKGLATTFEHAIADVHAAALRFCKKCGLCCEPECKARMEDKD